MKKIIFLFAFLITSSVIIAQVNLKKLSSPCDCIKEAISISKKVLKKLNKNDNDIEKQNIIDHFSVDRRFVIDYCDKRFDMEESVDSCEDTGALRKLMEEIETIKSNLSVSLKVEGKESEEHAEDYDEQLITDVLNPYEVADDYCACAELEEAEKEKCHRQWVEEHKDAMNSSEATYEQGEVVGERMAKCDPGNAMKVLKMLQNN